MRARSAVLLAVLSCILATALGCTAVPREAGKGNEAVDAKSLEGPVLDSVLTSIEVSRVTEFRFPLDRYSWTARQEATVLSAESILENRCLRRYGFTPTDVHYDAPAKTADRHYGVRSRAAASRFGYHIDPSILEPVRRRLDSRALEISGNQHAVSLGTVRTHGDQPVPPNGCLGEARRILYDGRYSETVDPSVLSVDGLRVKASDLAHKDPRIESVFLMWSRCMAKRGYIYADPWRANDDMRWQTPRASRDEIAAAITDLTCRNKHNVIGLWYAVERAYQRELIVGHRSLVENEGARKEFTLTLAEDVIRKSE